MRKVIALIMTLCMILVLCACGQQTAPAAESTAAAENKAANTTGAYNIWCATSRQSTSITVRSNLAVKRQRRIWA